LKLKFPETYRHLIEAGINEDYTMGYASAPGFRAGTCNPFYWFDLEKNEKTSLKIFPITYMEGTFIEDLKLFPDESSAIINNLMNTVKQYNGVFVPLWHNHTVSDTLLWKNWKCVFEKSLEVDSN